MKSPVLDSITIKCVLMDRTTVPDGVGGYISTWTDGAQFDAVFDFDTSMQARIGEVQGVKSRYTVFTKKSMTLKPMDVFKRLDDGRTFRVTSDGVDKKTPPTARLDMRKVEVEQYILPR